MRLDKYLAMSNIGTRKKVHHILASNAILVNGQTVSDATYEVDIEKDEITYNGQSVVYEGSVTYMFYKPAGCITARTDAREKTVLSYFTEVNTDSLFMVGRLDKDTEGLLLLTNDGQLDYHLMNPKCHTKKTYLFWATGSLRSEEIAQLETGVNIQRRESGQRKAAQEKPTITKPAQLKILKEGMYSQFKEEIGQELYETPVVCGLLTIEEGKKHQVRRMLRAVGCRIFQLKRLSIGKLWLDENLAAGQYRRLTEEEIALLYEPE